MKGIRLRGDRSPGRNDDGRKEGLKIRSTHHRERLNEPQLVVDEYVDIPRYYIMGA